MDFISFLPKINKISDAEPTFRLTAPHDVRERVWDILNLVYPEHIIRKEGGRPTQIDVSPSPGYTISDALTLLATATYLAEVNDFHKIWGETPDTIAHNTIEMLGKSSTQLNHRLVKFIVNRYLKNSALKVLRGIYGSGFRGYYNESGISTLLDEAIECYRRYASSSRKRHKKETQNLQKLRKVLAIVQKVNHDVKLLENSARAKIDAFEEKFDTNPLSSIDDYGDCLFKVRDIVITADEVFLGNPLSLSDDEITELMREIRLETPPTK